MHRYELVKAVSAQAVAGSFGAAEADLTPPPGYQWMVYHISVFANSTTNCTCSVYLNQRFICGTTIGTADSADGSPVPMNFSDSIRFVWNGVSNGAVCNVQILVEEAVIGQGLLTSYAGSTPPMQTSQ